MKVVVMYFLCFLSLLQFGCPAPDSSFVTKDSSPIVNGSKNQNDNVNRTRGNLSEEPNLSVSKLFKSEEGFNYIGCWLGDKGGGLDISAGKIRHLTERNESSFSYKLIPPDKSSGSAGVLVEIQLTSNVEFLKPFLYLKYEGKDETLGKDKMLLRGYITYQDYLDGKFVTSEYFYRDSCRKRR